MANFKDNPVYKIHDDYYTPKMAWEMIKHLIPHDKVIWEAFQLNATLSKSAEYLRELGFKVVGDISIDFFKAQPSESWDIIIGNPPFSTALKKNILKKLVELDKPFIIILNSCNMFTKYMREIFGEKIKDLQIITPSTRLNFEKYNYETKKLEKTKSASFYSCFLSYKMKIPPSDLWLK